jgi:hypothetical protein
MEGLELHISVVAPPHFTMESIGMGHTVIVTMHQRKLVIRTMSLEMEPRAT